jgi:hypothetical protein
MCPNGGKQVHAAVTRRLPVTGSPDSLVEYATHFDVLFRARAQHEGSRNSLESRHCQ